MCFQYCCLQHCHLQEDWKDFGSKETQDKEPEPKWTQYYQEAKVLAGDFVSIRAHMPDDLSGKIVVTNTTTAKNVEELRKRGLHILVTTTPRLEGRSFGTNVMEAVLVALAGKGRPLDEHEIQEMLARLEYSPSIERL